MIILSNSLRNVKSEKKGYIPNIIQLGNGFEKSGRQNLTGYFKPNSDTLLRVEFIDKGEALVHKCVGRFFSV